MCIQWAYPCTPSYASYTPSKFPQFSTKGETDGCSGVSETVAVTAAVGCGFVVYITTLREADSYKLSGKM